MNAGASDGKTRPLAVLGDSDSAGFQDTISFPPESGQRGGEYRTTSLQWTEVLSALRSEWLTLGPREATGTAGWQARLQRLLGGSARAPRKLDHRNNFAISGALCSNLTAGSAPQLDALLHLMRGGSDDWTRGAVIIRIGINDLGISEQLERIAANPTDPIFVAARDNCLAQIKRAIDQLRAVHPATLVVVVGLFNNAHWARNLSRFNSPQQRANIDQAIDVFDATLAKRAASDPQIIFYDDRALFRRHFGDRADDGTPSYNTVRLGEFTLSNSQGDHPANFSLADGHNGSVWNAVWASALIELLNNAWSAPAASGEVNAQVERLIPPISEQEIVNLLNLHESNIR